MFPHFKLILKYTKEELSQASVEAFVMNSIFQVSSLSNEPNYTTQKVDLFSKEKINWMCCLFPWFYKTFDLLQQIRTKQHLNTLVLRIVKSNHKAEKTVVSRLGTSFIISSVSSFPMHLQMEELECSSSLSNY